MGSIQTQPNYLTDSNVKIASNEVSVWLAIARPVITADV